MPNLNSLYRAYSDKRKKKPTLKQLYLAYNKKYFKNRLSVNAAVNWSHKLRKTDYIGRTLEAPCCPPVIQISSELRKWPSIACMTLLHEMAHINCPGLHGKKWQKRMHRLASKGAFDLLW
jgi:hypothetical protein